MLGWWWFEKLDCSECFENWYRVDLQLVKHQNYRRKLGEPEIPMFLFHFRPKSNCSRSQNYNQSANESQEISDIDLCPARSAKRWFPSVILLAVHYLDTPSIIIDIKTDPPRLLTVRQCKIHRWIVARSAYYFRSGPFGEIRMCVCVCVFAEIS